MKTYFLVALLWGYCNCCNSFVLDLGLEFDNQLKNGGPLGEKFGPYLPISTFDDDKLFYI